MMRRVAERHRGLLPLDTVEGIWRVIIATFTYVQAPFSVHADVSAGDAGMRDSARFHFGFTVPYRPHPDCAAVIEAVNSENLFIQADLYHMARMGEDLPEALSAHRARIAHVQIADAPGRHEPGSGAIDFPAAFQTLDHLGYDGVIGCEYLPASGTQAGLGWMAAYRS